MSEAPKTLHGPASLIQRTITPSRNAWVWQILPAFWGRSCLKNPFAARGPSWTHPKKLISQPLPTAEPFISASCIPRSRMGVKVSLDKLFFPHSSLTRPSPYPTILRCGLSLCTISYKTIFSLLLLPSRDPSIGYIFNLLLPFSVSISTATTCFICTSFCHQCVEKLFRCY